MHALQQVRKKFTRAAFLIGNGPNLGAGIFPSWKDLLVAASDKGFRFAPEGLTNTEVYDLVELHSKDAKKVKQRVAQKLRLTASMNIDVHRRLMNYAATTNSPVLTTNFDAALETAVNAEIFHINSKDFTRFYPWKTYYGFEQHQLPTDGFGIWKIHGDIQYKDSIRLGLTDYMGSAERARKMIHKGDDRLFRERKTSNWGGYQTWLHIWFNMPIIIAGLGFDTDEVFLRWLLIERKRYMNLRKQPMNVWYICKDEPKPSVKNLLYSLGVQFKIVDNYAAIYG
ncbi:SIR2 family protein [Ferruginibacter sp.]